MKQISFIRKTFLFSLTLALAMIMAGCSFHAGGSAVSDDSYEELFPDKAASLGKKYKTSNLAYVFTLGEYGSMEVHVDTSEGHKFELDSENGGFLIQDSEGNEMLHAYCIPGDGSASPEEVYAMVTAPLDQQQTVNGRGFFYSKDGAYHHLYSYMADCGLDCGMILESNQNEEVFRLVAFRGKALEGASSDPYAYKGTATASKSEGPDSLEGNSTPEINEPNADPDGTQDAGADNAATSLLDPEVASVLSLLDTDYNKINWGVQYSVDKEMPYLVASIAPYTQYEDHYLLVGITNLYDDDICFSGSLSALSEDGEVIGNAFVYTGAIGTGNTVCANIYCNRNIPDGRIRWEECKIDTEPYDRYVPWEGDYTLSGDAETGYFTVDYSIYSAAGDEMKPGEVTFCLVDAKGNVLLSSYDYVSDTIASSEKYEGSVKLFGDMEQILPAVKDVAMFAHSTK